VSFILQSDAWFEDAVSGESSPKSARLPPDADLIDGITIEKSNADTEKGTMQTSTLTTKGQVTIPVELRKRLGLHPGDQVGFVVEDGAVRLVRRERRIEAAFGICKAKVSVTDEEMEEAIRSRAGK